MNEQLSLFDPTDSEQNFSSLSNSDSEQKMRAIQRFLNSGKEKTEYSVNTYRPGGKKHFYYRLSYRDGKKMKHLHIPGGNINSDLANYRADKLRTMIARGAELDEVIAAVRTYQL
jgi:hypothetical protein